MAPRIFARLQAGFFLLSQQFGILFLNGKDLISGGKVYIWTIVYYTTKPEQNQLTLYTSRYMEIIRVITKSDLKKFIKLPYQIYKNDPV